MIKQESGFTMIELLVSMVMFVFVISAASQIFTAQLTQFKQQSKIAETNIEGTIGLELLRRDIKHAGYGLPWVIPAPVAYLEALSTTAVCGGEDPITYNDAASRPPRAILSGNDNCTNNSDYLVIKAVNVARNSASEKTTNVYKIDDTTNGVREWKNLDGTLSDERLETNDRVIVISPGATETNSRTLVAKNNGDFYTTYQRGSTPDSLADNAFAPSDLRDFNIVYGISHENSFDDPPVTIAPRMPFNRADYYISTSNVPGRCAANTGVLEKATVNHKDGALSFLPLLDCVANFQVVYRLDMNEDGEIGTSSNADGSAIADVNGGESASIATVKATFASASLIRKRLKEIRVYILAQEGQKDPNYTHATNPITVGPATGEGWNFDITTITDGVNYRWKLYILVVNPENLLG